MRPRRLLRAFCAWMGCIVATATVAHAARDTARAQVAMQNDELFREAGGERLRYIPALNARRDHMNFLTQLVLRHLQGWPETSPAWDTRTRLTSNIS